MKQVIVIYGVPRDPAAFDRHYAGVHIPLTRKMPHLKGFEVSRGPVAAAGGGAPVHLVAILSYASAADLEASLASPEGQAAVADVANFATGGATLLTIDSNSVL